MSSDLTPGSRGDSNAYLAWFGQAKRQRCLLSLHWELTHRCSAQCAHCYLDVLPPRQPDGGYVRPPIEDQTFVKEIY